MRITMELFEKYLCKEVNIFSSVFFKYKLIRNRNLRKKFEQYKIMSNNLKYMFVINKYEIEIKEDKKFIKTDSLFDQYLMQNKKEDDILNYFDRAYSK